ncbi:MAG: Type and secretion system protein [Verrucomicrobiales bacterium]|nr:Type and secretion system protein [Verrucomicrobiales bacterium]
MKIMQSTLLSILLVTGIAASAAQVRTNSPAGGSLALPASSGVSSRVTPLTPPSPPTPTSRATGSSTAVNVSRSTNSVIVLTNAVATTNAEGKVMEAADIFFNFDNTPLVQVLEEYSSLVNRTILRSTQLPITTFINLKTQNFLTKAEAISALETVMAMNGITVIPIGEKFMKVVTHADANGSGAQLSEDISTLPDSGKFVTQVVQLKYVPVQDASTAISPFASGKINPSIVPIPNSQTMVLRDFSENIKRMLEILNKIDVVSPINIKPEVIPIKYALASDIQQVLGSLTTSGPGLSVGRSTTRGLSSSTTLPGGGVSTGGYVPPGAQGNPGGTGMNQAATSGRSSFQNRLAGIVGRASAGGGAAGDFQILGQAKIIADERTNSLLIFANDEDMATIKDIISRLDVVLAQVLIEAIVMEVSLDDSKNVGVSYLQQPKKFGGGVTGAGGVNNGTPFVNPVLGVLTGVSSNSAGSVSPLGITNLPGGFSYFGKVGNSFDVAVSAAANDSRVNVLSRPQIQTSHAVEAQLFIGDTVPYVSGTYFGGVSSSGSSSQYQQKEVGITLNVLPLINPDGLVVMDISQNIEQLGTPTIIDGNPVPTTTKRQASAKVAVRDRETIVLGGFISTQKSKTKSGVPYLKDIPYLGGLFRSKSESTKRVELMVFLRPTVLPTPEAAAIAATQQRDMLPGIKQTEWEIKEEERKRRESVDREMRDKMGIKEPKKKKVSGDKS